MKLATLSADVDSMNTITFIKVMLLLTLLCNPLGAQETLYPAGFDIDSRYFLSADQVQIDDTLYISRYIVNNEAFPLAGLFFSDNLPPCFEVISHSVRANGLDIDFNDIGPIHNHEIRGYDSYMWIIDDPKDDTVINYTVQPGDSISLELGVVCAELGAYYLPAHASVFYGNASGFFSTSDTIGVEFVLQVDVDEDSGPEDILPSDYLTTSAYPNPFNSSVAIRFFGSGFKREQLSVGIFDLLGRNIYDQDIAIDNNEGHIVWIPDKTIGSGLYFYKITVADKTSAGKLVFLK
jgi:hypothetical protein